VTPAERELLVLDLCHLLDRYGQQPRAADVDSALDAFLTAALCRCNQPGMDCGSGFCRQWNDNTVAYRPDPDMPPGLKIDYDRFIDPVAGSGG
jgi:hypothetical protein